MDTIANSDVNFNQHENCESPHSDEVKTFGFSKTIAEFRMPNGNKLGYTSAMILRYISYQVRRHGRNIDGKKWWRMKLDHIASRYSFLARSTAADAIVRLVKSGACEVENLNSKHFRRTKLDRTHAYHVPVDWMKKAETELRYFDRALACRIGVPAAVVYRNFMHWVSEREQAGEDQNVKLSPTLLDGLLPFDRSTIKRAIAQLVKARMIKSVDGKRSFYAADSPGSKPDENGSEPDNNGSKPDENGSKPDDNIYCSHIVDSLENCSKTEPSARSFDFFSFERKNIPTEPPISEEQQMDHSEASSDSLTGFPDIANFEHLHELNRNIEKDTNSMLSQLAKRTRFAREKEISDTASELADSFFVSLDRHCTDTLFKDSTAEERFQQLFPEYRRFVQKYRHRFEAFFDFHYFGVLECVISAFDKEEKTNNPNRFFCQIAHWLYMKLWKQADEERLILVEQEFKERHETLVSIDVHMEGEADLSPAEKTRVFKQGLFSRNRVGAIHFDQQFRTDEIKISKAGLRRIENYFEQMPNVTPGQLLAVMDCCLALHREQPGPKCFENGSAFRRGVKAHARNGHSLSFFARYLPTILKQVGRVDLMPTCDKSTDIRSVA